MSEEPKGSFVRWQKITIDQLTYAINLILTFAVATLGFQTSLFLDGKFDSVMCLFGLSMLSILASSIFGILVVINRMQSIRYTAKTARAREQGSREEEERYRARYRWHDPWTWRLFWSQISTFGAGVLLMIASIVVT